jgi:hypothetical protein
MSRSMTAAMLAAIAAGTVRPFFLFEAEFASGTIWVWTGHGDLTWGGKTWNGVGDFSGISTITETGEVRATGLIVSLSGISAALISAVYNEARQGKPGTVWIGALTSAGAVVDAPFPCFKGRLDVPSDEDDGERATITISYESLLVDLERPKERRYTPEDQAIDYPDDRGFAYVAGLQDVQLVWGRA